MLQLVQPILSTVIGLMLAIYGLVHSFTYYPGGGVFAQLWASLPSIGSMLVFLIGVLALVAGLVLLYLGLNRARRRWKFMGKAMNHPSADMDEDQQYGPGYQYG